MDIQDTRILVRKFNALFKHIEEANAQPSSIERDLMLSYLRQLYAHFLEVPQEDSNTSFETKRQMEPLRVEPVRFSEPETPIQPVVKQEMAVPPPPPAPVVTPPPPAPKPEPVVVRPTEPPVEVTVSKATEPPVQRPSVPPVDPELERMFNLKRATELSERLGESPVSDLTKSMSINDRLLYMNELFGKDRSALEESLLVLNRFDSFDSARSFLHSLAEQYKWSGGDRLEIAQAFIKLVRRRYL